MEESNVATALQSVTKRVEEAKMRYKRDDDICIVAVSKTKPKSLIIEAYSCGHQHFGENYVNELVEKASDAEVLELCPDIKWHFIGHLQSNKVNKLLGIQNLYMIHTVDSKKLADLIDRTCSKLQKPDPLKIMIQVNTSSEDSKSGVSPDEVEDLAKHITENCKHVHLAGLMLIGYANYDLKLGPNPEFQMLSKYKSTICEKFNINPQNFGLSMGMSQDFEHAIELGSNYVRVGSTIFGAREKK